MKKVIPIVLSIVFIVVGCQKDKKTTPSSSTNTPAINYDSASFEGFIDGVKYNYKMGGFYTGCYYQYCTDAQYRSFAIFNSSVNHINDSIMFGIRKGWFGCDANIKDSTALKNFFADGNYAFTSSEPDYTWGFPPSDSVLFKKDEISIYWINKGDTLSTMLGTGDQTGSNFTLTKVHTYYDHLGEIFMIIIRADFNCKLYNTLGQSKTLTNGVFIGMVTRN